MIAASIAGIQKRAAIDILYYFSYALFKYYYVSIEFS